VYRDSTHRLDGSEQNVRAISERHRPFSGSEDETTFRNRHKLFPKVYTGFRFKGCTVQKMHEGISAKVRPIHAQTVRSNPGGTYAAVDGNGSGTPNTACFGSFNCMHMG
jgi:hypothetical protein